MFQADNGETIECITPSKELAIGEKGVDFSDNQTIQSIKTLRSDSDFYPLILMEMDMKDSVGSDDSTSKQSGKVENVAVKIGHAENVQMGYVVGGVRME